jgi:hypothetical protein
MQSPNPAAAKISRRLAPAATTILPHHLLCDSFSKGIGREAINLMQDGFSPSGWGLGAADLINERELVRGAPTR